MGKREFFLDALFPKFCQGCQREGDYLCADCFQLVDFLSDVRRKTKNLKAVFAAASYNNFIVKGLIRQLKYEPFVKDLAETLASLIIHRMAQTENPALERAGQALIPIPLTKKRLKERGFNQAEEIAKELSRGFRIPLLSGILVKVKETEPQVELPKEKRAQNVKGAFVCKDRATIKNKTIILVDDVFTTGSTMEEAALVLKSSGAKEVFGIVAAAD